MDLSESLLRLLKLAVLGVLCLCAMSTLSSLVYLFIQSRVDPSSITQHTLHFDFSRSPIVANLTLSEYKDQWTYSSLSPSPTPRHAAYLPTMKPQRFYEMDLSFRLARSPRNQALGKIMIAMQLLDANNEVIASSSRPVLIPFHPSVDLSTRGLILSFFRLSTSPQPWSAPYDTVRVKMFNAFQELRDKRLRTKFVTVSLSTAEIDLGETEIVIADEGTRWKVFKTHPFLSFLAVLFVFNGLQMGLIAIVWMFWQLKKLQEEERSFDGRFERELMPSSSLSIFEDVPVALRPVEERSPVETQLPLRRRSFSSVSTHNESPVTATAIVAVPTVPEAVAIESDTVPEAVGETQHEEPLPVSESLSRSSFENEFAIHGGVPRGVRRRVRSQS